MPNRTSYGIAELYGESFIAITNARRVELLDISPTPNCPHLASFPDLAPIRNDGPSIVCSKAGGICSIRKFLETDTDQEFGQITATCPLRFYEDGLVFNEIGRTLLQNPSARIVKEIDFLKRPNGFDSENEKEGSNYVGRIDMVMVDVDGDQLDWCAVELQAVYFSGAAMSKDFPIIRTHSRASVPMPGGNRRPDFRSSGPKRLMPQLQIKVPTLRRWGKKMAVVVDRPFFNALGEMDQEKHLFQ